MLNHYIEPENRISEKRRGELLRILVERVRRELDSAPPADRGEYQAAVRKLIMVCYAKIADEFPLRLFAGKVLQDGLFTYMLATVQSIQGIPHRFPVFPEPPDRRVE